MTWWNFITCSTCPDIFFMEQSTWSEISIVDLRIFVTPLNHSFCTRAAVLVNSKRGTSGNKCHQSQSLCFICSCNSITLPPRRPGICRRMSRSNPLHLVMVLSFAREMKYNIIKWRYAEWSVDRSISAPRSICLWVLCGSPVTDPAYHWNIPLRGNLEDLAHSTFSRFMAVNMLRSEQKEGN